MAGTHKEEVAMMHDAVDKLRSALAALDRDSTTGINTVMRQAEGLAARAQRVAKGADLTHKLAALPAARDVSG